MDDTNYWSFECDTCTREFSSQHAKEQHMTAVSHWAPRYQTPWATTSVRSVQHSTDTDLSSKKKEDAVTNDTLETSAINDLDYHQQELVSCIARYICSCPGVLG
ncbi:hypothetical protein PMIN01_13488 [Paraphaeosphaeria minitans]|uniref:C2H2-type domain-containing protein n=1 Tax=Paraphaeosphaeria minitans TaxID=565426 RepID=A0A9P6G6B2_9PLEO|nr:hypothetical protein PMIN01_13488 [Paraphaeosphaeria minitans]